MGGGDERGMEPEDEDGLDGGNHGFGEDASPLG